MPADSVSTRWLDLPGLNRRPRSANNSAYVGGGWAFGKIRLITKGECNRDFRAFFFGIFLTTTIVKQASVVQVRITIAEQLS